MCSGPVSVITELGPMIGALYDDRFYTSIE
jgi:hypothetical protein